MIGSIQKKGRVFYVVLPVGQDPKTRRWKTKWIRVGPDRREAENRLADIKREYEQGRYREEEKMTVKQYLDRWLEDFAKISVRRNTYESYEWSINKHITPNIGMVPLQKLKPAHIQSMLAGMSATELSRTSIRYIYAVLNIALNRAVKCQILVTNPCFAVEPPRKENYNATVYNREELIKLLDAARTTKMYLPILLAASCGLRRGEVCGLRWKDILLDKSMLYVRHSLDRPKKGVLELQPVKTTSSERAVRLPEILVKELTEVKAAQIETKEEPGSIYTDQDFVYAWGDGKPVDPDFLDKRFRELLNEKQLKKLRFHDLRHTHATMLLL
jgi:integrase